MGDYWQKLAPGANYTELNTRLNGLPDYLRKQNIQAPQPVAARAPAQPAAQPDKSNWLKWLESFNMGVIQGVPFAKGALDKLAKAGVIPETRHEKLMTEMGRSAEEKPGANVLGNIAGGIGATGAIPMIKPVAGGVGLAAKGILPSLARGATNAAAFAVPQTVSQAVETGDVAGAVKGGLMGIGTGALMGAAGGAAQTLLEKGYKTFRNWLNDAVLKAGGVRGREMMKVLQGGLFGRNGFTPQKAMQLKEKVADAISKEKLYGKQSLLQFLDDQGKIWNEIDDAWAKSGAKVDDFRAAVQSHPDVAEHLASAMPDPDTGKIYSQYAQATLDDIFAKAGSRKDLPATRELLWTTMKNGLKEGTNLGQIKADVASALRDSIDNAFVPAGLKEDYPALLALKKSIAWNEASVARAGANSATAPRQMLGQVLKNIATNKNTPGFVLGSAGALSQFDPKNPATWGPSAAILAGSTVGGNLLNRVLAKGGTQLAGRLAGAARNVLPKEMPVALAGLGRVAQAAGTKATPPATQALMRQQGAETPMPAETPADASVAQSEAAAAPEAVQAARDKVNPAYRDRVMQALQADWVNTFAGPFAQYGLKYDDFVQMVGSVTGGFDDPRKTARILFHDKTEREKFLSDYDAALKFGQQDVGAAMEYKEPGGIMGFLNPKPAPQQLAYQNLIDYLSGVSEGGKEVSETARKRIEERIRLIAGMKIPQEQKKKMIEEMLTGYGIDLSRLSGMGLYGAPNG